MLTIFSPLLSAQQAEQLFPVDENLNALPVHAAAVQLVGTIAAKYGKKILCDNVNETIKTVTDLHTCEQYMLDGEEALVCATCQISSGVVIKFVCTC